MNDVISISDQDLLVTFIRFYLTNETEFFNNFRYIRCIRVAAIIARVRNFSAFYVVLFKKATSSVAARSHPLSVVPINPAEVFGPLVFGGYIKASFASSPRTRSRSPSSFSTCSSLRRRLSNQPRLSMQLKDECADKSRDFFLGYTLLSHVDDC